MLCTAAVATKAAGPKVYSEVLELVLARGLRRHIVGNFCLRGGRKHLDSRSAT